jgi:tellurite resistance protein TerC
VDLSLTVWVLTVVGLCALIAADFFIGGRKPHEVSLREAGIWTVVWVVLAALFGLGLFLFGGGQPAGEFFAGYITEKSLSVDNLFVFVLIMAKFAVPTVLQQRVLMVGVLIALVLRAVFIAAGAAIIANFSWIFYLFGAFSSGPPGSSSRTPGPARKRRSSKRTACSRRSRSGSRPPTATRARSCSSASTASD